MNTAYRKSYKCMCPESLGGSDLISDPFFKVKWGD